MERSWHRGGNDQNANFDTPVCGRTEMDPLLQSKPVVPKPQEQTGVSNPSMTPLNAEQRGCPKHLREHLRSCIRKMKLAVDRMSKGFATTCIEAFCGLNLPSKSKVLLQDTFPMLGQIFKSLQVLDHPSLLPRLVTVQ